MTSESREREPGRRASLLGVGSGKGGCDLRLLGFGRRKEGCDFWVSGSGKAERDL